MNLFYAPHIAEDPVLPQEEAVHALRVLRMRAGDTIVVADGKGTFYKAELAGTDVKHCTLNLLEEKEQDALWGGYLHLAMAPTKNMERNEWLVEKATEIGIDEITFLNCHFSERKVLKTERLEKIAVSAMKQSLKAKLPLINELTDFVRFMDLPAEGQKFIAHCHPGDKRLLKDVLRTGERATILIGPEGDFSEEEVALATREGYQAVSLGASRLRTETAALAACHTFNLFNQQN